MGGMGGAGGFVVLLLGRTVRFRVSAAPCVATA